MPYQSDYEKQQELHRVAGPNVQDMMWAYGTQPERGMKPAIAAGGYPAQSDEDFMGNTAYNTVRTLGLMGENRPPSSYVEVLPSLGLSPPSPAIKQKQQAQEDAMRKKYGPNWRNR